MKELSDNLATLFVIWNIVIEWENFERNVHGQKLQVSWNQNYKGAIHKFRNANFDPLPPVCNAYIP